MSENIQPSVDPRPPREELSPEERMDEIEILVIELEGVLTDGTTTTDRQGDESITTFTPDAVALKTWQDRGLKLVVSAREDLTAARRWCEDRDITFRAHQGLKAPMLQMVIFENQAMPHQVAYAGAAMEDIPAMMVAGLSAAPSSAPVWPRDAAHIHLEAPGGRGAAAELVTLLLDSRPMPQIAG